MNFEHLLSQRRSIYELNSQIPISLNHLQSLLSVALKYCPSAFNSQPERVVLLTGYAHKKLWQITSDKLKQITDSEQFSKTQNKLNSFSAGFGSILFFTDTDITKELQARFPPYSKHFPTWAEQSQGMLQFIIWTLLAEHHIGASLQHYNPLISESIHQEFALPSNWKLTAQMPFGGITAFPEAKSFLPIENKLKIFGNIK
ncbi:MAG: nitroreductase [Alphaproteobacteria bacterium]|nr:nitroreductase [Alphaproteobacteria bacterium]